MVSLYVDSAALEIKLAPIERTLAMHRAPVRISRSQIAKVQLTDDPFTWLRGVRAPGSHVPNRLAFGTWRSVFGDDFVAIRSGRPAVVIDLEEGAGFQRVILSTTHGADLVNALQPGADPEA
ncbi:hypothetical protein [Microbacterium indicum]|uniref:hypothetical protein n=1 Tax=Microbacterium indicum TaxID=358100 RepID=UPI0003FD92CF|nr:hypothetical protein [Microbacterium indicum]